MADATGGEDDERVWEGWDSGDWLEGTGMDSRVHGAEAGAAAAEAVAGVEVEAAAADHEAVMGAETETASAAALEGAEAGDEHCGRGHGCSCDRGWYCWGCGWC